MSEDLFDVTKEGSVVLRIHVQPGAGRTAIVGRHGDALKVRVAAPPSGGRANEACTELIAGILGVKGSEVTVSGGESSRQKRLTVTGIEPEEVTRLLDEAMSLAESKPGQRRLDGRE
ncbi:MAG TPA: DUF167 domain-containing protein [Acidimicrobiales bacterium]|nr:DUF167 domain-containing protein [Acidimicrobiales bacterium]